MKKIISVITIITSITLISCRTATQKEEYNQTIINKANKEYLKDIEAYKQEMADKITANNKSISDFKLRIQIEKQNAKEDYEKKIAELEQKSTDAKKKLDDYTAEGKENLSAFKNKFDKDMKELNRALNNLTANTVK